MPSKKTETELFNDQITDIVKKKRGAKWTQDLTAEGGEGTKPGDNARYVRLAMASWDLPPIDISDPKQVEQRIADYFRHCAENDRKPQLIGMANWLGVDRSTVNSWKRGEYRAETHSPIIKKSIDILEELWVDFMQNGKVNPGAGIFLGKNLFGYKDVADVVVTPNSPYNATTEPERAKKYLDGIVTDDTETE